MMFAYAETGQGAVVMCNSDRGFLLINEVMRSIAREYGWPDFNPIERAVAKVNPEIFKFYVGEYDVEGRITVSTQDGKLFAKIGPMGGQTIELYPLSETEFFVTHADIRFVFTKDDQGIVNGMIAHLLSRSVKGKKIK
jgi:hypothetical protein